MLTELCMKLSQGLLNQCKIDQNANKLTKPQQHNKTTKHLYASLRTYTST